VAVWCEEAGHDVQLICYTGFENLSEQIPDDIDLLFVSAFTQAAQLSYAISAMFQKKGIITALGGPHARCYPQDAQKYFDYVFGFTDKETLAGVLADCSMHRPLGVYRSAKKQPATLPGDEERWKFIEPIIAKAPAFQIVPMIGSLGCPYTCPFCIDSVVEYQPMGFDQIRSDLRFLRTKLKRPRVGWHDPNFGVRFNDYLDTIEDAVTPGSVDFLAESSLSLLSEPHLKRMRKNGFKAILPGIESWYSLGNKAGVGSKMTAQDKVRHVSEHVNMILEYIPYVQTNFVLGLDEDKGAEPFELTKQFVDMTPGAFPGYSLLTAFGQAAPLNLELQRDQRVSGFPFHFLNNNHAMNVKPRNYEWREFYDRVIDLTRHTFSWRAIMNRFRVAREPIPRWMNVVRAVSTEGFGRIRYHTEVRRRLDEDSAFMPYFEGESDSLPQFYVDRVQRDLGAFWHHLPAGSLFHDPNAYLKAHSASGASAPLAVAGRSAAR
jgi:hypothetical protein